MDSTKYYKIAVSAAVLAVIIFLVLYYYQDQTGPSAFQVAREKARDLYIAGDKSAVIGQLENEIKNANSKDAEASAAYVVAGAYLEVDFDKSIDLFKSISADTTYPPIWRARAETAMANYFMLNDRKNDAYTKNIFSGAPYASFAEPEGTNTLLGARRIYNQASKFYVMPFSEYRIAEWHIKQAALIKFYGVKLSNPIDFYISRAKQHIAKGDTAAVKFSTVGKKTELGHGNWVRGSVFAILYDIEKKDDHKKTAEDSFIQSFKNLDLAENAPDSFIILHKIWASFSYSSFLTNVYGKERIEDIKKLNKFIIDNKDAMTVNSHSFGLIGYITRLGQLKPVTGQAKYDYDNAIAIAKIDPAFKIFLNSLGWGLK